MSLTLNVELGDRSYPIYIGPNQLVESELVKFVQGKQCVIVTNQTVAPLFLDKCKEALAGKDILEIVLPDGEQFKSMDVLNDIFTELLKNRQDRKVTLIALGGGVIGDITGFAAACYQRGVPFIQIPTTLLAQVDSSVGGKTAVNHPLGKNMIGAFYQPKVVIADADCLQTLPSREWAAGMAEVIKYGLIYDLPFYQWIQENKSALKNRTSEVVSEAIFRSCKNKADIVAADETEQGLRAILNLGHTFGHAIEAEMGYGEWLHGEAVAAGMVMAADLSVRLGWISEEEKNQLVRLLQFFELPTEAPKNMSPNDFLTHMSLDKKVEDGVLRLVLLQNVGNAIVTNDYLPEQLEATLLNS